MRNSANKRKHLEKLQPRPEANDSKYDLWYDCAAMAFLHEVGPLFYRAIRVSVEETVIQLHTILSKHLNKSRKIPIEVPPVYVGEEVPHLFSMTRILWRYLITYVVFNNNRMISDQALAFIASVLTYFFPYARTQRTWHSWEEESDEDLYLCLTIFYHCYSARSFDPPKYIFTPKKRDAEYINTVEVFHRGAKFAAYLFREESRYHEPLHTVVVTALGRPYILLSLLEYSEEIENAVLILPAILRIAGVVLHKLCHFDRNAKRDPETVLEWEVLGNPMSKIEYNPEHWTHWRLQARTIFNETWRTREVREAAEEALKSYRISKKPSENKDIWSYLHISLSTSQLRLDWVSLYSIHNLA